MIKITPDKNMRLTQWDIDRKVTISGIDLDGAEVHFASPGDDHGAYVVKPEGDTAVIPNILLTLAGTISVYVYPPDYTVYSVTLPVTPREKPDDYVYTPSEVLRYETLEKQIGNLDELKTTAKDDLVSAINEAAESGSGKVDAVTVNGVSQPIENKTAEITINKATVGLGNVDNTADTDKPVSNPTQVTLAEKLDNDEVYDWAKAKLPFTANEIIGTYNPVADCFVTNPTNFTDGKPYFRYHAGSKSFTWTNPNPAQGKVTITVLAWNQYNKNATGNVSRLNIGYSDGASQSFPMPNGTVYEFTTDSSKTLSTIKGNYDLENWVLLDLTVLKIVYDDGTEAPFALKTDVPAVVDVTASATAGQAADAKAVWDMIGDVKSLIDSI